MTDLCNQLVSHWYVIHWLSINTLFFFFWQDTLYLDIFDLRLFGEKNSPWSGSATEEVVAADFLTRRENVFAQEIRICFKM